MSQVKVARLVEEAGPASEDDVERGGSQGAVVEIFRVRGLLDQLLRRAEIAASEGASQFCLVETNSGSEPRR